jgi:hypothetical protein
MECRQQHGVTRLWVVRVGGPTDQNLPQLSQSLVVHRLQILLLAHRRIFHPIPHCCLVFMNSQK